MKNITKSLKQLLGEYWDNVSLVDIHQTCASVDIPVVDALEGLFAGQQDVGQRQADVHSTLTLSNTLRLKLTHFLWVGWNHHLKQGGRRTAISLKS